MKKNYLYGVLTILVWSTTAATVKSLLNDIPNMEALSLSSFLGSAFLLLVNLAKGRAGKLRAYGARDYLRMAGMAFVGLFLYSVLYYHGLNILSSQEACILNYLWPIMLVIFSAVILKERMNGVKLASLLCSFAGIIILSSGSPADTAGNRMEGIVCCVVAAACYGLFSVLNKKADYDQSIAMTVFWLTVAVCAGTAGLATERWVAITPAQWLGLAWLGVVIDAVAYLLWALALRGSDNTAAIANMAYLTPFLSLVVSAVFLRESIQVRAVVALVFIVGGIAAQSVFEQRGIKSES